MKKVELLDLLRVASAKLLVRPYGGNPRSVLYALEEAIEESMSPKKWECGQPCWKWQAWIVAEGKGLNVDIFAACPFCFRRMVEV